LVSDKKWCCVNLLFFLLFKDKQTDNDFAKQIFFDLNCDFVIQFLKDIGARMDWNRTEFVLGDIYCVARNCF